MALCRLERTTLWRVEARNDMDLHADMCCPGTNWTPLVFTGEVCTVSPYSGDYSPKHGVPVAMDNSGATTILAMHQMLWFGTSLPNTLINPIQLRMSGTAVYDHVRFYRF